MDAYLELIDLPTVRQAGSLGSVLLEMRRARGFTQDQLIERCGHTLSKSYLSQIESGRSRKNSVEPIRPSVVILDALAEALGASKNELRRLARHPQVEDEFSRDDIADEFAHIFARYKQLSSRGRGFVRKQVSAVIDLLVEIEASGETQVELSPNESTGDVDVATQTIHYLSPDPRSAVLLENVRRPNRRKGDKGK